MNITIADFSESRLVYTCPFYQYDYGQILRFRGVELPDAYEVHFANTDKTGESVTQIGNAHGLNCIPYKMDAEEVVRQDRPSIVWWRYNHFCVCCGLNESGDVVICNPDRGRFPIDLGSFKAIYSGVAMFNGEPTEEPTE